MWTHSWNVRMTSRKALTASDNALVCKNNTMCNVDTELEGAYDQQKSSEGVRQRFVLQQTYYVQCGRRAERCL